MHGDADRIGPLGRAAGVDVRCRVIAWIRAHVCITPPTAETWSSAGELRWLALVLALVAAAAPAAAEPAGSTDQKSVLTLLPVQPGLPAAVAIAAGVRSVLVSAWSIGITIETEHVDIARFNRLAFDWRELRRWTVREANLQRGRAERRRAGLE